MTFARYARIAVALAAAGTAFAGYLSGVKLLTSTCAFNEPCPYVWGFPACWYGFGMFAAMTVVSVLGLLGRIGERTTLRTNALVSAAGISFASWLTVGELENFTGSYGLGLPTCAYGLIVYIAMFALTVHQTQRPASAVRPSSPQIGTTTR